MKTELLLLPLCLTLACNSPVNSESKDETSQAMGVTETSSSIVQQQQLKNDSIREHNFLVGMYNDDYFPDFLVDKLQNVLITLCADIESSSPADLDALYTLSHTATEKINTLQMEFEQNGSEIETAAREELAAEFSFIAETYGFDADVEELIAPREW